MDKISRLTYKFTLRLEKRFASEDSLTSKPGYPNERSQYSHLRRQGRLNPV